MNVCSSNPLTPLVGTLANFRIHCPVDVAELCLEPDFDTGMHRPSGFAYFHPLPWICSRLQGAVALIAPRLPAPFFSNSARNNNER